MYKGEGADQAEAEDHSGDSLQQSFKSLPWSGVQGPEASPGLKLTIVNLGFGLTIVYFQVHFSNFNDKEDVLRKAKLLKGAGIHISEDFSRKVRNSL